MGEVYHKHHIIPKHCGGSNRKENIVLLTVDEHAEAHRLLYEQYGRRADKSAWLGLKALAEKNKKPKITWIIEHIATGEIDSTTNFKKYCKQNNWDYKKIIDKYINKDLPYKEYLITSDES